MRHFRALAGLESRKSKASICSYAPSGVSYELRRVLFLQNTHVSEIMSVACLWYMIRAIAYCEHEIQQRISLSLKPLRQQPSVGREKIEMRSRNPLYCSKWRSRIALRSLGDLLWTAKSFDRVESKISARSFQTLIN